MALVSMPSSKKNILDKRQRVAHIFVCLAIDHNPRGRI